MIIGKYIKVKIASQRGSPSKAAKGTLGKGQHKRYVINIQGIII